MTEKPNEDARAVAFSQEGQPDREQSNGCAPTIDELAHNVAEGVRNAQESAQAKSAEDKPDEAQTPETPKEPRWGPDYTKVLAGKVHFLKDYCNLEESAWMRGRTIVSDYGIRMFFASACSYWQRFQPGLYKDGEADAALSRVKVFSIAEIAKLVRSSRRYVWLSFSVGWIASPVLHGRYPHIVEALDFVGIAVGSALSGLYFGIHLYRVVPGWAGYRDNLIAKFYGGRVYENHREIERLRAAGLL